MNQSILELLHEGDFYLKRHKIDDARESAEQLLMHVLHKSRIELYLNSHVPVLHDEATLYRSLLLGRIEHMPVQYLTGRVFFRHCELEVINGVLIPRPETELLVDVAIKHARSMNKKPVRLLDVGTGSGNISISFASEVQDAEVVATDCSKDATLLAMRNVIRNQVEKKVTVVHTHFWGGINEQFDMLVSNPPYLSAFDFVNLQPEVSKEPMLALSGGLDGLRVIREIIQNARKVVRSGGRVVLEIGKGQADAVRQLMQLAGCRGIEVIKDLSGIERIASALVS